MTEVSISKEATKRVCLSLQYTDPGRILNLCRSLFEKNSILLQRKLNRYLMSVINCEIVLNIFRYSKEKEFKINVIGNNILPMEVYLDTYSPLFIKLNSNQNQLELSKDDFQVDLLEEVESCLFDSSLINCLAHPILHPANGKLLMNILIINYEPIIDHKRIYHGLVSECMRYTLGTLINSISYNEVKISNERNRHFINTIKNIIFYAEDEQQMFEQIKAGLTNLTSSEKCNIFLKNSKGDFEAAIRNSGEQVDLHHGTWQTVVVQSGVGITGRAAEKGSLLNSKDLAPDLSKRIMSSGHRNQLSCPYKEKDEVVGIIDVYNKVGWSFFTLVDEQIIEEAAMAIFPLILHSRRFKLLNQQKDRRAYVDSLCAGQKPTKSDWFDVASCELDHHYPKYNGFQYSHLEITNSHIACMIVGMFSETGLTEIFKINRDSLTRFVLTVMKEQGTLAFHNWTQSFGAMHFAINLVNSLNLVKDNYMTPLEVLALLLATLSLSLSHCGSTTPFQVTSGTALASLYSSPQSLQQKYQFLQIFRIINSEECCILKNLSEDQFKIISRLVFTLLISSDFGSSEADFKKISSNLQAFNREDLESRLALLKLLFQCSYMNDFSKSPNHLRMASECLLFEFFRQGNLNQTGDLFDLSQFSPSTKIVYTLQTDFMEKFCLQPFRLLSVLFPNMLDCLQRLESNLHTWEKFKEHYVLDQEEEEEHEEF